MGYCEPHTCFIISHIYRHWRCCFCAAVALLPGAAVGYSEAPLTVPQDKGSQGSECWPKWPAKAGQPEYKWDRTGLGLWATPYSKTEQKIHIWSHQNLYSGLKRTHLIENTFRAEQISLKKGLSTRCSIFKLFHTLASDFY